MNGTGNNAMSEKVGEVKTNETDGGSIVRRKQLTRLDRA